MAFEPTQFGKYTLYEKLAVGGMAIIYRGRIQGVKGFQKDLVIKQILPQYSGMNDFIDMFIDEAKIAVNLNHANIVPVYELGEIDGQLYIAMEYVAGKDLQSILEQCEEKKVAVPPRFAAYIMTGVCRGLDYAHNKKDENTRQPLNIIHRDISPNNVIVSYEGEVKIIDFGIAKASIKVSVTQFGTLKGKMIYMSPEQAAEHKLDPRSDVFSAGILLYELVTGKKPYGGDNFVITQDNVKKAAFVPPQQANPAISPAMAQIILKAMARDPNDRFGNAFDFERALSDFLFSTGQNVYARDVAQFLTDLFAEGPMPEAVPAPVPQKIPTVTNIRNLSTDAGARPWAPPPLPPTPVAAVPTPAPVPVPVPVPRRVDPPMDTEPDMHLRDDAAIPEDAPQNIPSMFLIPEEGPAIEEDSITDSGSGGAAPSAPEQAVTPARAGESAQSLLGGEPFAFEIPPEPAAEPRASQRDTVVTRLPPRTPAPPAAVPSSPADAPTPPPVTGREGVVPGVARAESTRTSKSSAAPSWLDVAGPEPTPVGAVGAGGVDTNPGVVPVTEHDEETAPGGSARELTPRPSVIRSGAGSPQAAAPPAPRPRPPASTPPPAPPASVPRAPSPSTVRAPVNTPAPAPPRSATTAPPWANKEVSVPEAPAPAKGGMGGFLNRVIGRKTQAPTAATESILEGFYDSPHDFLTNSYATYGDRRGLFLTTTLLDTKLGVDLPLDIQFRAPQASFRVHGRVIWRRAKEGTSKGKRLPAGLAIEFVDSLDDDLEALFAYLGLP